MHTEDREDGPCTWNLRPGALISWSLGDLGQVLELPALFQVSYTEQAIPGKHASVCLDYFPSSFLGSGMQTHQMRDKMMQDALIYTQAAFSTSTEELKVQYMLVNVPMQAHI